MPEHVLVPELACLELIILLSLCIVGLNTLPNSYSRIFIFLSVSKKKSYEGFLYLLKINLSYLVLGVNLSIILIDCNHSNL